MAGTKREAYKRTIARRRIIELVNAGYSVVKIMAMTGKSYRYVSMIIKQERKS